MRRLLPALLAAALLTACAADDDAAATDAPVATSAPATTDGTDAPADDGPSAELVGAQEQVGTLAPALESAVRGTEYPTTVEGALAAMADAGLATAEGYTVTGYAYDPDAVEFTLCVEHDGGAWATYDTAPMSLREQGETGGCPAL